MWTMQDQHQQPAARHSVCCREELARQQTRVFPEEPALPDAAKDKMWDLVSVAA
jgi:hypothetical protein